MYDIGAMPLTTTVDTASPASEATGTSVERQSSRVESALITSAEAKKSRVTIGARDHGAVRARTVAGRSCDKSMEPWLKNFEERNPRVLGIDSSLAAPGDVVRGLANHVHHKLQAVRWRAGWRPLELVHGAQQPLALSAHLEDRSD